MSKRWTARRVAVIGGGIAGLTAAHELAGRGFDVTLHEMRPGGARGLGGKARSQYFAVNGAEVPGEHGYRFMPAFYRCLPETMARIPGRLEPGRYRAEAFREPCGGSVRDSLVGLSHMAIARENFPLLTIHRNAPRYSEVGGLVLTLAKIFHSISGAELHHIGKKLLHYCTRGPVERMQRFEQLSFWEYMEADKLGPIAQRVLECTPQALVAMKASEGSARTLLDVLVLMMLDFRRPGPSEFVLPGPTTDTWLGPWARWLAQLGVRFEQGPEQRVTRIEVEGREVVAVHRAGAPPIRADWYVLATPLEATQGIVAQSPAARDRCAELDKVAAIPLDATTRWMVGVQFLLRGADRPWVRGHVAFGDSPWGITGVSQRQFWRPEYVERLTAAGGSGMLSIIATEWNQPRDCEVPRAESLTLPQIQAEIIRQIAKCRDADQQPMLRSQDVLAFHFDQDVGFEHGRPGRNRSPLLIHPPGSWARRPSPASDLRNLVLCGDHVQNPMDLATMEGACASARMAANVVLDGADHDVADRAMVIDDYQREHVPTAWRQLGRINDVRFLQRRGARMPAHDPTVSPESREEAVDRLAREAARIGRQEVA
ncbi:MAG: FAD-dependent oxidoreductase [Kofleriaceae bacterium]|nr:MAG: FAD-dependent oxidoreductase [Kofleriaceae bacterium]